MKNIAVLGSTGSIGTQTLEVVRRNPELFHISVLAANSRDELFEAQVREFEPELAVLADVDAYNRLKSRYSGKTKLAGGRQAFIDAAAFDGVGQNLDILYLPLFEKGRKLPFVLPVLERKGGYFKKQYSILHPVFLR